MVKCKAFCPNPAQRVKGEAVGALWATDKHKRYISVHKRFPALLGLSLIHKSESREVSNQWLLPCEGKVDREARRKGSLPSLSVFTALA